MMKIRTIAILTLMFLSANLASAQPTIKMEKDKVPLWRLILSAILEAGSTTFNPHTELEQMKK